jgi:hypothetical protein
MTSFTFATGIAKRSTLPSRAVACKSSAVASGDGPPSSAQTTGKVLSSESVIERLAADQAVSAE